MAPASASLSGWSVTSIDPCASAHSAWRSASSWREEPRTSNGESCDGLEEVVEELEEGRLGPVEVVDEQHERTLGRQRLKQPPATPHQLGHRELGGTQVDRGGDTFDDRLAVRAAGTLQQPVDPPCRDSRRVLIGDAGGFADCLRERPERDAVAVREATTADQASSLGGSHGELPDEPRLADACVADNRGELGRDESKSRRPAPHRAGPSPPRARRTASRGCVPPYPHRS